LAREDSQWSYGKIQGALCKVGPAVSATVLSLKLEPIEPLGNGGVLKGGGGARQAGAGVAVVARKAAQRSSRVRR